MKIFFKREKEEKREKRKRERALKEIHTWRSRSSSFIWIRIRCASLQVAIFPSFLLSSLFVIFWRKKTMERGEQNSFFDSKRRLLVKEEGSLRNGLTDSDRSLLRKVFTFDPYFDGSSQKTRDKQSASIYLKDVLELDKESPVSYDILQKSTIPTIFPTPSETNWFSMGKNLTSQEMVSVTRIFQQFSRIYSTDYCFKKFRCGTKTLICGPVSFIKHQVYKHNQFKNLVSRVHAALYVNMSVGRSVITSRFCVFRAKKKSRFRLLPLPSYHTVPAHPHAADAVVYTALFLVV